MKYLLKCLTCGATCWVHGAYEADVNALSLDEGREREWEPPSDCPHEEFEVIDEEDPEPD